jgi:hypothetical protein
MKLGQSRGCGVQNPSDSADAMDACRRGKDEGRREASGIGVLDFNRRLRKSLEQSEDAIADLQWRGFWRGNWSRL